jgi:hypothetical protein
MAPPKKSRCVNGHALEGDNVVVNCRGAQVCVTCARANDARFKRDTLGRHPGRGRHPRGEEVYLAKLTEEAVQDIRTSPATNYALAEEYGVSRRAIQFARSGRNWKHV